MHAADLLSRVSCAAAVARRVETLILKHVSEAGCSWWKRSGALLGVNRPTGHYHPAERRGRPTVTILASNRSWYSPWADMLRDDSRGAQR
jgi:hypothetical protein